MMESMKHCMPREKSDLQLYFDTYSLFLKQSMDSLHLQLLVAKDTLLYKVLHFTFVCCLLLTMSNLISYLL